MRCSSGTVLPDATASWSRSPFHAIYIGRLDDGKRVRELVEVLIATCRTIPEFSASLFGDGPLRASIEDTLGREAGHRLSYGGLLTHAEVFPRLLTSQALVLLSGSEGLSTAIQEAMACGLPVIARRTASGTDGVLLHERTALVIDDDRALTDAVRRLVESDALWQRLSAGARTLAQKEFDIDRAADRWSALLMRLAGQPAWPASAGPDAEDAARIYLEYLEGKRDLETFEGAWLAERARAITPGLLNCLKNPGGAWETRRWMFHRLTDRGLFGASTASQVALHLADEAEASGDLSEALRYRVATLHQRGGDVDRAEQIFAGLAETADEPAIRVGSLYHLAVLARDRGRTALAIAFAERCLSVEPQHRAARALQDALQPHVSDAEPPET
jgi:hypothetical protein